jgi:hypothetical protein
MNANASGKRDRAQTILVRSGLTVWVALGIALLFFAVSTPRTRAQPPAAAPAAALPPVPPATRVYTPEYTLKSGKELVLVFVGGSFCRAHRRPGFHQAVEDAKIRVRQQARARGQQFRAVAVSLDWKPGDALSFLEGFGEFDEISVGSNWVNDSAIRYVWREMPGDPTVPQLLVVERKIDVGKTVRVSEDRVVKRVLGATRIQDWVAGGASL